jgi:hypothetical protein
MAALDEAGAFALTDFAAPYVERPGSRNQEYETETKKTDGQGSLVVRRV